VSCAGFSSRLTSNAGLVSLNNGANSVTAGASWSTTGLGGFTDGQFQSDGGYIIPVGGVYHFDATIQVQVSSSTAPDEDVDIRLVKCANGCNALCTGNTDLGATLIQVGEYVGDGFNSAPPPAFSLAASFTGSFNSGDIIAVCIDSNANTGAIQLSCSSTQSACEFSGFGL